MSARLSDGLIARLVEAHFAPAWEGSETYLHKIEGDSTRGGFGVNVEVSAGRDDGQVDIEVNLPHQCDSWVIAGAVDHREVVVELSAFMLEVARARSLVIQVQHMVIAEAQS